MSIPVYAVRIVNARAHVDPDVLRETGFLIIAYPGERFRIIEVRTLDSSDLSGTWDDLATRHDAPPPQKAVPRDADVNEARVARADGVLIVLVPGERSARGSSDRDVVAVASETDLNFEIAGEPELWSIPDADSLPRSEPGPKSRSKPRSRPMPKSKSKPKPMPKPMPKSKPMPTPAGAAAAPELPSETVTTTFNADFEDHDRDQPLQLDQPYVLAFYAGKPDPDASASVGGTVVFNEGELDARLTIQVTSNDFTIEQPSQALLVKRDGTSRGRARFDVTPTKKGKATLTATILKDGNFVRKIDLIVNVGIGKKTIAGTSSAGRTFSADETIQSRDLVLLVEQTGDGGMEIIALRKGSDPLTGRSDMTAAGLADLVTGLRGTLKTVIEDTFDDENDRVAYTDAIEIQPAIHEQTMATVAEESLAIFRAIFFESGADEGMKKIGRLLASLAAGPSRDIQVVTTRFVIPWQLLYAALELEPVQAKHFLGFSHRIEHLALKTGWDIRHAEIRHTADLRISVNVNRGIDEELDVNAVEEQLAFFEELKASGKVQIEIRDTVAGVKQALTDPQLADQVVYLYCHAVSHSAGEGVGKSALLFEGRKSLTLSKLRAAGASEPPPYRGAPLVFINACQSAELSPLFYDGFVPHLTSRGARGVIGTECDTPALFGAKWGQAFFREFLEGGELGEVMLTLRRRFLEEQHNLLGLLYAVHCNGNTRVDPRLGLTEA